MVYVLPVLLLCTVLPSSVPAYTGPDLPPGPYCGTTEICCEGRKDDCSYNILGSKCYCDQFCKTRDHDDCCPDYEAVCLGAQALTDVKPPKVEKTICNPGDISTDDCNTCKCIQNTEGVFDWDCDQEPCVNSEYIIDGVNQANLGWRAANYTQFHGKKLKDALIYKLGTFRPSDLTARMGHLSLDNGTTYPLNFDARTYWKGYISPVMDQGWCGSDWAVSVATTVSDRFAIQSNGAEKVILSPQILLSCNKYQKGCRGGNIDAALIFAKNFGLVDEDCFPYTAKATKCLFKKRGILRDNGCKPVVPQRTDRYRVGPPGRLLNEADVMYDLMDSGPVQAVMTVYQDFFHYQGGIYRRSQYGNNELKGHHSVRIVGWGEENGQKYWIVANSWGTQWGEDGFFRILRGENESGIEDFIVTVLSDVTDVYMR